MSSNMPDNLDPIGTAMYGRRPRRRDGSDRQSAETDDKDQSPPGEAPAADQTSPGEVSVVRGDQVATERAAAATDSSLPFHPVANLFPLLEGPEYQSLKEDIQAQGLRCPVLTYQGQIIDGRNRYRACRELGIEPKSQEWDGQGSLVDCVLSLNQCRRHLNESQRAMVAARLKSLFEKEAQKRMLAGKAAPDPALNAEEGGKGEAAAQAAARLNVGRDSVYKAQKVLQHGTPALQRAVDSGQVSVSAAADLTDLSKEEQEQAVAGGTEVMAAKAKEVRQNKPDHQRQEAENCNGENAQQEDAPAINSGKDPKKKTPSGAQPGTSAGKNRITLDLSQDVRTLAKSLVEGLGHKRAKGLCAAITKILPPKNAKKK